MSGVAPEHFWRWFSLSGKVGYVIVPWRVCVPKKCQESFRSNFVIPNAEKIFSDLSPWLSTPKESSHIFVGSTNCMPRNTRPHRSCFFFWFVRKAMIESSPAPVPGNRLGRRPLLRYQRKPSPFWKMLTAWLKIHGRWSKNWRFPTLPKHTSSEGVCGDCDFCWGSKGHLSPTNPAELSPKLTGAWYFAFGG